jgi:hypothetical protein
MKGLAPLSSPTPRLRCGVCRAVLEEADAKGRRLLSSEWEILAQV